MLKKKNRKLANFEKQLKKWENKRITYLNLNHLAPRSKIDPSDKHRIQLNNKINGIRANVLSLKMTISNIEDKIIQFTHDIPKTQEKYNKKLVKRLQEGRMLKYFKDVIYAHPKVFEKKYEQFLEILKKNKSTLAKYLKKFIKNNPHIFTVKQSEFSEEILPNYLNTNSIESIFGRYRIFLDKYRTILGSDYQESIFEILRLRHNFSTPYTGPRSDTSPLQRLGIQSKYSDYLDALFCEITV